MTGLSHVRVGFVGAGQMGGPMVQRLLSAGAEVHLLARRPEVRQRFAGMGAVIEESLAALAGSASLLIACPFSEAQLLEITDGPGGLITNAAPGTVLVQHTTVSVATVEKLAADGRPLGVAVLDAPVSGTSQSILAGRLTVLVGGEAPARERAVPALRTYSAAVIPTGDIGSATKIKLVNNLLYAANTQTVGAAVELGEALGIRPGELLAALTACSSSSFALGILRELGDGGEFVRVAAPYLRKDVAVAERLAADLGVSTGVLGTVVHSGPFNITQEPEPLRRLPCSAPARAGCSSTGSSSPRPTGRPTTT